MTDESTSDTTTRESKYKLWTAIVTLLGVIVGFGYTAFQLLNQSRDLQRIEQNFRNIDELKKALMKPLEGVLDYKTKYTKYFGKDNTNPQKSQRNLNGKAIFIRHDDGNRVG